MEESRILTIFMGLVAISSGIFFSYPSLPPWSIYIIIPLLFIMFITLILISPIPSKIKDIYNTKRYNRFVGRRINILFQKFKSAKFINRFEKLYEFSEMHTIYDNTIPYIISELSNRQEFSSLKDLDKEFSIRHELYNDFDICRKLFRLFDNQKINKNNFVILLRHFRLVLGESHHMIILRSIEEISKIVETNTEIKMDKHIMINLQTYITKYNDDVKYFNDYIEDVNETLGEDYMVDKMPIIIFNIYDLRR